MITMKESNLDKLVREKIVLAIGANGEDNLPDQSRSTLMEFVRNCASEPINVLTCIELGKNISPLIGCRVQTTQFSKDFQREKVIFNDIPVIPSLDEASPNLFINILSQYSQQLVLAYPSSFNRQLCENLIENLIESPKSYGYDAMPNTLSIQQLTDSQKKQILKPIDQILLAHSCRTIAGAQCLFILKLLFKCNSEQMMLSQAPNDDDTKSPPITIELFVSSDEENRYVLKSITKIWNSFVLYDIEHENDDGGMAIFMQFEALLVNEFNYMTGQHTRTMQIFTYMPEKQRYFQTACHLDLNGLL